MNWNHIYHLIDLKVSTGAFAFAIITLADSADSVKIFGGLIFIGYTIRRWVKLEKLKDKNEND